MSLRDFALAKSWQSRLIASCTFSKLPAILMRLPRGFLQIRLQ